jgi:hypothetical protein
MIKRAQDFAEELVKAVTWLEDTALVVKEKVEVKNDMNWEATTGPLSDTPDREFKAVVASWRAQGLRLNWEGAELEDGRRVVVRWISV